MDKMPTKRQRHAIYKKALRLYFKDIKTENPSDLGGLCWYLGEAYGQYSFCEEHMEQMLPEIWKHRPKKLSQYIAFWWSRENTEKRIAVLKSAIEETAPEQKQFSHE